jgi:ribonuclease I
MNVIDGRRILAILAAVFVWGPASAQAEAPSYVLALSWQPAFCESDVGTGKAECRSLDDGDWAASHFTLHGLWPNADRNKDGRQDEADDYCLPPAERAQAVALDQGSWRNLPPVDMPSDLSQRLRRVMPGVASKLERHEWIRHGSCSGMSATRYFSAAVALTEAVAETDFGEFVTAQEGQDVARRDLLSAFSAEFGKGSERALQLLCRQGDGGSVLSEIRLRLRAEAIEAPLSAQSFDTRKVTKGNCPARFHVAGVE